jgi:hypothetical protein
MSRINVINATLGLEIISQLLGDIWVNLSRYPNGDAPGLTEKK